MNEHANLERSPIETPLGGLLSRNPEEELEWNDFEKRAVDAANDALAEVLASLDLPVVAIPPEHIHIVNEEQNLRKLRQLDAARADAAKNPGHLYIPATEDRVRFCVMLLHVMCHAVSLAAVQRAHASSVGTDPGAPHSEDVFEGLNEGAMEHCSAFLVERFVEKEIGLTEKQVVDVECTGYYPAWIYLLGELIGKVARDQQCDRGEVHDMIVRDYFSGTSRFLQSLERAIPGAGRLLSVLRSSRTDAVQAARATGIPREVRDELASISLDEEPGQEWLSDCCRRARMDGNILSVSLDGQVGLPLQQKFRLRAARIAAGLTQGELATRLGVSRVTVNWKETGRRKSTDDYVRKTLVACGLPDDWLPAPDSAHHGGEQRAQLAAKLRAARQAAGLTQAELARRLHAWQSIVSATETGKSRPDDNYVRRVLETCGLPEDWMPEPSDENEACT